jgi:hypothetical protein
MGRYNVRDQVVPIFVLLEPTECHLCAGNVLLRVLEILKLSAKLASVSRM